MQTKLLAFWALLASLASASVAAPVGTAFTYQGRLADGGVPVDGYYDFNFKLFPEASGGIALGEQTLSAVFVTNGLFTTNIDFGADMFSGAARWLEISARTNATGAYALLGPRQELKPTPYALYAAGAAQANAAPWSSLTGVPAGFSDGVDNDTLYSAGEGLGLSGSVFFLNTNFLNGRYWQLGGNGGTTAGTHFLGTTDDEALELKVNNNRVLRLEPDGTIIGGSSANDAQSGSVIAGGGTASLPNLVRSGWSFVGAGRGNTNDASGSVIGGGYENKIMSYSVESIVGGGYRNFIGNYADQATIGGGAYNRIESVSSLSPSLWSTIAGGWSNLIARDVRYGTISGGSENAISMNSWSATIAGGTGNATLGNASTIGGGAENAIGVASFGTVSGGGYNTLEDGADASGVAGYGNSIAANAAYSVIAGGRDNDIGQSSTNSTVSGGRDNNIGSNASSGFIGGGRDNDILGNVLYSAIVGGNLNSIARDSDDSFVGGGYNNNIGTNAVCSTVGGGYDNDIAANADASTISGGRSNDIGQNSTNSFVGGGNGNDIGTNSQYATVVGGYDNNVGASCRNSFVGGGSGNDITTGAWSCFIGGGYDNNITGGPLESIIAGGGGNLIEGLTVNATIGGGGDNSIANQGSYSTIAGGRSNVVNSLTAYGTIPGGRAAKVGNYGQMAYASGAFAEPGDAQVSTYVLRGTTTGLVTNELFLDGVSARMRIPENATWAYEMLIIARTSGTASGGYHIRGVIENNGGLTQVDGTPFTETLNEDAVGLNVLFGADDAHDALTVKAVGVAGSTYRWVVRVRTVEVTFP